MESRVEARLPEDCDFGLLDCDCACDCDCDMVVMEGWSIEKVRRGVAEGGLRE